MPLVHSGAAKRSLIGPPQFLAITKWDGGLHLAVGVTLKCQTDLAGGGSGHCCSDDLACTSPGVAATFVVNSITCRLHFE